MGVVLYEGGLGGSLAGRILHFFICMQACVCVLVCFSYHTFLSHTAFVSSWFIMLHHSVCLSEFITLCSSHMPPRAPHALSASHTKHHLPSYQHLLTCEIFLYLFLYLCSQIVFDEYNTHTRNIRVHYYLLPYVLNLLDYYVCMFIYNIRVRYCPNVGIMLYLLQCLNRWASFVCVSHLSLTHSLSVCKL